MFKFLVLGVFLSQAVVKDCYGQTTPFPYDSQPDIMIQPILPQKKDSSDALLLPKDRQYQIYASRLNFYLGDSFAGKRPMNFAGNAVDRELDVDYVVTKGMGAHKLHVRKVSWSEARRICIDEGGHLAVIRSDSEEKILLQMMVKNVVDLAWIGYHDTTKENDWFSVFDEPLGGSGWGRWSSNWSTNPNINDGQCAELYYNGGMTNSSCENERAFICKVSID